MQSAKLAQLLLTKAKQDHYAMNCLLDDPSAPDEAVGFHAQQAVEKSLKAVLALRSVEYARTHQLQRLATLLRNAGIFCPPQIDEAVALTPYAVDLRYDMLPVRDDTASPFDRQWAKRCVACIAEWAAAVVEGEVG
jgi:HEPN domain-containing protein